MSSPQPSYSGMHVKGGLLRARFLFVVLNHGADTWARVLSALPDEERESLKDIVVDNWYPLGTLDLVDRAIAEHLGDGDKEDEVFDRLGEFSATSSLSGPYSSLINPDVHSFLDSISHDPSRVSGFRQGLLRAAQRDQRTAHDSVRQSTAAKFLRERFFLLPTRGRIVRRALGSSDAHTLPKPATTTRASSTSPGNLEPRSASLALAVL